MPGLDQLYPPKRDDRAPLRHRTHLQRFRRSGAGDNAEEMRAVRGSIVDAETAFAIAAGATEEKRELGAAVHAVCRATESSDRRL